MKFAPKSEEEVSNLLPAGVYDFEVSNATDEVSKKGNDMIKVTLKVFKPSGGFSLVTDYLMEVIAYKLRHFAAATGLMDAYQKGEFTAEACIGRAGKVKLGVQEQEGYQPRNEVKDYAIGDAPIKHTAKAAAPAAAVAEADGVPF